MSDDSDDVVADVTQYLNELSTAYHSWDERLGESFDEWAHRSLRPWTEDREDWRPRLGD